MRKGDFPKSHRKIRTKQKLTSIACKEKVNAFMSLSSCFTTASRLVEIMEKYKASHIP